MVTGSPPDMAAVVDFDRATSMQDPLEKVLNSPIAVACAADERDIGVTAFSRSGAPVNVLQLQNRPSCFWDLKKRVVASAISPAGGQYLQSHWQYFVVDSRQVIWFDWGSWR